MKIPATVITGFLGAGKTSVIRHMLKNANGKRIAVIINEFGDLGIDREMLTGCAIEGCEDKDVLELANGCICCTVADEFLPTMEMLLERPEPPDHIVIETSGLALPKPLVKAFNWPEVRSRVTVDGVIAIIDGAAVAAGRFADDPEAIQAKREDDDNLDHESPLEEVYEDQVRCADIVVLNKMDIINKKTLASVRDEISKIAKVKIINAVNGVVDSRIILGLKEAVEDSIDARKSHHDETDDHNHDDFDSFVIQMGIVSDPEALEKRIISASKIHDILRVKGFIHVHGKEMRHVVQGVGNRIQRYYDRPWRQGEERRSQLVIIGQKGIDQSAIQTAISH